MTKLYTDKKQEMIKHNVLRVHSILTVIHLCIKKELLTMWLVSCVVVERKISESPKIYAVL